MEGIDRLKLLVDDLLDLSKMEAGKFILNKELFNGVQLLEQIRSSFATQASAKGLEVRLACPLSDVLIYADRGRILQILTNLVGNAIKFTDKGHIELSLGDKDNQIECSVADTGVGIAEEDLPKMFSKFQQFGGASTGMVGGTGLGLSIAKNLVELHRGAIRVESALNRGTRFTFTLPKVGENEIFIESVEASVADARQKGEELLLLLVRVEDDSSSNQQKGEVGVGNAHYKAMERLAVVIRRLGFTNSQGKDCIVVYGHVGKASAPEAEETISYQIPTYNYQGPLVHFVARGSYCSFIVVSRPVLETLKDELKDYDISGTTIHFTPRHPLPEALVEKIVKTRIRENKERTGKKALLKP
jgi:uncharacterized protein YdhG (YjbR/CyaY superfamily)